MADQTKITPLPWEKADPSSTEGMLFSKESDTAIIKVIGAEYYYRERGRSEEEFEANYEYVYRAVNQHQNLIDALKSAISDIQWMSGSADFGVGSVAHDGWVSVRERLDGYTELVKGIEKTGASAPCPDCNPEHPGWVEDQDGFPAVPCITCRGER